jgi:hypothetical protein
MSNCWNQVGIVGTKLVLLEPSWYIRIDGSSNVREVAEENTKEE